MHAIKAALDDLIVPEINVTHNDLTNEDEVDIVDEKMKKFKVDDDFKVPYLFTIGEVDNHLVFDMNFEEYYSVDSTYLASVN